MERNVGDGQRAGGAVDAEDVGIIFRVGGKHEGDDLGFALEAFGEQRADGAVDLAAGENFALAGTAFALDEAAGDASAGVGVFAVIDGEGEEVDAFAGIGIGDGGGENDVVAQCGPRPSREPVSLIFQFQKRWFYRRRVQQLLLVSCSFPSGRRHKACTFGEAARWAGQAPVAILRWPEPHRSQLPHEPPSARRPDDSDGVRQDTEWKRKLREPYLRRPSFWTTPLVAFGIVCLEVVEQATPLADQHEKTAA